MKLSPETSDPELIAAVLEGSEAAFAQLIGRYQDRVFRLLGRYCRDPVECEDLAQEVFLKVFRKLHTFQQNSAFYTWVYRIAVNAATDHLSRASHRRLRLVEDERVLDPGDGDEQDPAAPLQAAELAAVTRRIVDSLPEKFRTILVLREFEDLSYTEIAAVLQIQLGTVESRLFRARQRFKQELLRLHPELVPGATDETLDPVAGARPGTPR
ncbi:MAG: sigma-70 family RNA polymerase sigma factor [Planctomycetes bacterium]|nr:sigma-70 family RNA polymerase sigma factor [Planctomycetota bacterium]